jgi:hypothetical protein
MRQKDKKPGLPLRLIIFSSLAIGTFLLNQWVKRASYAVPTRNFQPRRPMPQPPGHQKILTLVAPVKPGEEKALNDVLFSISNNRENNPYINFSKIKSIHFARWLVIHDDLNGYRFVFSCTYNGEFEQVIKEIADATPGLDAIWGKCTEYTGRDNFLEFARGSFMPAAYRFFAFPNESPQTIRDKIAIRSRLQSIAGNYPRPEEVKNFLDSLHRVSYVPFWTAVEKITGWLTSEAVAAGRYVFNAIGDVLARFFANWGLKPHVPTPFSFIGTPEEQQKHIQHLIELDRNESPFQQNQFTLVAEIRPERYLRLRFLMLIGRLLTDYGYPPGSLIGVYTIHSLYWVILDGGQRAILCTNYDGNWSSYLGDFARLATLLDALFNNVKGYPPSGLRQVNLFNSWIRGAQLICPLYYSGYPDETVLNIIRDREIAATLGQEMGYDVVERLLELL